MRLGYVVTHFPPLTETFIRREVAALCEAGDEVFVYAETVVDDPLVTAPLHPRLTVRRVSFGGELARAVRDDRVEHLHGTLMLHAQQAAFAAARETSIPFSITAYSGHSVFTARGSEYRDLSASPLCAGVVVEDEFMRDFMAQQHDVDPAKMHLVPNSLDLEHYRPPERESHSPPRILAIARFIEKKGLGILIEAFRELRTRRDAELHLIGSGPDEPVLRHAARDLAGVHFLGAQPESRCRKAYDECDIFALPCILAAGGDADGIATVVLEAMACGLPVVVSDLLSAPLYVRDGVEGLLVPPGDVTAVANALDRLCDDARLRNRLGDNGRRRVEERCDIRQNCGRLRELFAGARPPRPLVSVCITAYNREQYVAQSIDSVLAQTYPNIEIVVADDGSTDGTANVLARYGDKIRVVRHERNRGCPAAKNLALRATSPDARYVAILDSDDRFLPDFVARCVDYLETHPEHGLVYVNEITVDAVDREMYRRNDAEPWDLDHWLRTRHLRADTWLARRDPVMATALHDEELPMDEDYDLFYQLLERTTFAHLAEALVVIRRHGDQMTRDHDTLARCHAAHLVKYGFSPEYAYLRARHNPEWVPAIEEGVALGRRLRERRTLERRRHAPLAIDGGTAVRATILETAHTNGHHVSQLEEELAAYVGAQHAIAVGSATAALTLTLIANGVKSGTEVITTPLAEAMVTNAIENAGAKVVFAAIDPHTLNLDPDAVTRAITARTAAIVPSHFAGLPCDLDTLRATARAHNVPLIEDAVHAIGARHRGQRIGGGASSAVLAIGEGAVVTTADGDAAQRLRVLRARYDAAMPDLVAAASVPEVRRQEELLSVREHHARQYADALGGLPLYAQPRPEHARHALHRYVVRLDPGRWRASRDDVVTALRAENIGAAFLQGNGAAASLFALPLSAAMTDADTRDVIDAVWKVAHRWAVIG